MILISSNHCSRSQSWRVNTENLLGFSPSKMKKKLEKNCDSFLIFSSRNVWSLTKRLLVAWLQKNSCFLTQTNGEKVFKETTILSIHSTFHGYCFLWFVFVHLWLQLTKKSWHALQFCTLQKLRDGHTCNHMLHVCLQICQIKSLKLLI